jgi:PBSX family phage terminase large subunit
MEFRPHPNQQKAFDDTANKIILAIAGKRGGKTTIGAIKFLNIIRTNIENGIHDDYLIVGPTYRLLRNATIPTLLKFLPAMGLGIYKKSDSCVDLVDGHKIFIVSAEDEDKIEGFKARDCWCDEGGQVSRTAFDKIWQRTTPSVGEQRGQIIITTTPYGVPSSWLNKDLIENRKKLGYIGYYNWATTDNPYMATSDIETAKDLMDPQIFRRDYLGEYTNIAGLIYPDFDRTADVVAPYSIPADWPRYAGIDYGFSDPTVVVVFAKDPVKTEYILEDSYYKSGCDMDDVAAFLNLQTNLKEVLYDPSAVGIMMELRKKGRFNLRPAVNDVAPGIAKVTAVLKQHLMKIFNTNEKVIEDLESYIYAEGKEKPCHNNSHGPDAIRYCFQGSILNRKSIKQITAELTKDEIQDLFQKAKATTYHPLSNKWPTEQGTGFGRGNQVVYIPVDLSSLED